MEGKKELGNLTQPTNLTKEKFQIKINAWFKAFLVGTLGKEVCQIGRPPKNLGNLES